jgi:hypothetical protein
MQLPSVARLEALMILSLAFARSYLEKGHLSCQCCNDNDRCSSSNQDGDDFSSFRFILRQIPILILGLLASVEVRLAQ